LFGRLAAIKMVKRPTPEVARNISVEFVWLGELILSNLRKIDSFLRDNKIITSTDLFGLLEENDLKAMKISCSHKMWYADKLVMNEKSGQDQICGTEISAINRRLTEQSILLTQLLSYVEEQNQMIKSLLKGR
jgi:hypothetical protein